MLCLIILSLLSSPPDDPPKPVKPAAMILDLKGKVEIRPIAGPPTVAVVGDLVYPIEKVVVSAEASATLSILGVGVKETLKPSTEVTIGPKGCSPAESIASRKEQPKSVASTMKGIRPSEGDGRNAVANLSRKAGVNFRSGSDQRLVITPIHESTISEDRPTLTWPTVEKVVTYRIKLISGAGRELWRAETTEPRLAFPEKKEPLQAGSVYRWEVTDQDYRKVAAGEFSLATASERAQFDELKTLAGSSDRADRYAAVLAYQRLAAYAEAIATCESLVQECLAEPAYRRALAELQALAGRSGAPEPTSDKKSPVEN